MLFHATLSSRNDIFVVVFYSWLDMLYRRGVMRIHHSWLWPTVQQPTVNNLFMQKSQIPPTSQAPLLLYTWKYHRDTVFWRPPPSSEVQDNASLVVHAFKSVISLKPCAWLFFVYILQDFGSIAPPVTSPISKYYIGFSQWPGLIIFIQLAEAICQKSMKVIRDMSSLTLTQDP